jgi:hypothetical protein
MPWGLLLACFRLGPTLVISPRLELWTLFDLIFYLTLSYVTLMHEQKKKTLRFNVCTISLQGLPNMYNKTYQLKMNEIVYVNYFPLISYH